MSRIVWHDIGQKFYETGVDRVVLYLVDENGEYPRGVPWNGCSQVSDNPSGAEPTALYADNNKYITLMSKEEAGGSIEAYTHPDEFYLCDGSAELAEGIYIGEQPRRPFGLCYRTILGNDVSGDEYGYKIHIVYGALASTSDVDNATQSDTPEANTFSWDYTCTPVNVPGHNPSASIEIVSTKIDPAKLSALEDILYGTADTDARLPLPAEIAAIGAI